MGKRQSKRTTAESTSNPCCVLLPCGWMFGFGDRGGVAPFNNSDCWLVVVDRSDALASNRTRRKSGGSIRVGSKRRRRWGGEAPRHVKTYSSEASRKGCPTAGGGRWRQPNGSRRASSRRVGASRSVRSALRTSISQPSLRAPFGSAMMRIERRRPHPPPRSVAHGAGTPGACQLSDRLATSQDARRSGPAFQNHVRHKVDSDQQLRLFAAAGAH